MGRGWSGLPGIFFFNVLDRTSPFYAPDCKAGRIRETAYDSGLPFQGALKCFVELPWLVKVYDVDVSVCCPNHEKLVFRVKGVHPVLAI